MDAKAQLEFAPRNQTKVNQDLKLILVDQMNKLLDQIQKQKLGDLKINGLVKSCHDLHSF
jgi:hypothetical protein